MGTKQISIEAPHILRPRLFDFLDKSREKRISFVFGQAAQGKTTLIASYLQQSDIPSAWMYPDAADGDPTRFFRLTRRALDHALREEDPSEHPYSPPVSRPHGDDRSLYPRLAALFNGIPRPFNMVIDGVERFLDGGAGLASLESMMAAMGAAPEGSRLFILSREIPPPGARGRKVRQDALVVGNEDLAFTRDEIRSFFLDLHDISLDPDQLSRAHDATEGWAGGLVLLAESLHRPRGDEAGPLLHERTWETLAGEALTYFSEEIFEAQSEATRDFFVRSSVFDVMDPGVMKCFMGAEDADDILRDLVKKHLFIRSRYTREKGWRFRYHGLFRDFLKTVFHSRLPGRERRSLFSRAGALFMAQKDWTAAIRFFLKAGEFEKAASAMEIIGSELLRREQFSVLGAWIDALPRELVQEKPWLRCFFALTRRGDAGVPRSADLREALDCFKTVGDIRGQMLALTGLIEASVFTGGVFESASSWMDEGEALLGSLKEEMALSGEKVALLLRIGLARIVRDGDLQKGISTCENARVLAGVLEDDALRFDALAASALGLTWAGEFELANDALERTGRFEGDGLPPRRRATRRLVSMELAMSRGDLAEARTYLHASRDDIEAHGLASLHPAHLHAEGVLNIHQGNFREAERIANQLSEFADVWNRPCSKGPALGLLAMSEHHQGAFEEARSTCEKALAAFAGNKQDRPRYYRTLEMMGLIRLHLEDYPGAGKALDEALAYFERVSSRLSMAETHLALGLLKWAVEDRVGACAHLRAGLKIAERKAYVHAPVMRPEDVMNACLLAVELGVEERLDYAAHLLSTRFASLARPELERLSKSESMHRKATLPLMRTIHRANLPRLRIVTFGGFRVFRDSASMEEREWGGGRPKHLLKAIVAHGIREIPKDLLIDELWPDSPGPAAERSFKVNLHRLRKALEPGLTPVLGSSYIHLKDNLVSLDPGLCRVDLEAFLTHRRRAVEMEAMGDLRRALVMYDRALEVYRGEFLAEELYTPWAERKREALKEKYVEALCAMAELHERRGASRKASLCYTRAIKTDPYLERAHQRLMSLYFNRGMRGAALKVYEDFKAALSAGIGAEPSDVTTSIYRKILETS